MSITKLIILRKKGCMQTLPLIQRTPKNLRIKGQKRQKSLLHKLMLLSLLFQINLLKLWIFLLLLPIFQLHPPTPLRILSLFISLNLYRAHESVLMGQLACKLLNVGLNRKINHQLQLQFLRLRLFQLLPVKSFLNKEVRMLRISL